jgi:hypothetical protein
MLVNAASTKLVNIRSTGMMKKRRSSFFRHEERMPRVEHGAFQI